jgi:hypothetical protein
MIDVDRLILLDAVTNLSQCHYLMPSKTYIVFLQETKSNASDSKKFYELAPMEEIEINSDTMKRFLNDECADEDDYGIDMTMFFHENNRQCGQFTAKCNGK